MNDVGFLNARFRVSYNGQTQIQTLVSDHHQMLYWIVLIFQYWFGFELVSYLVKKNWNVLTRVAISIPVGNLLPTLIFFIMSAFIGANMFHIIVHLLLLGAGSILLVSKRLSLPKPQAPDRKSIASAVFSLFLAFVIVPHFYFPEPRVLHTVCFDESIHFDSSLI